MGRDGTDRLRQRPQALGAPDPLLVALIEEPRQHAAGARDIAYQPEPGQKLEPVQGERNVADVALGVRAQRVAQQLEDRLEQLLAGQDEKRTAGRPGGEVLPEPPDESPTPPPPRRGGRAAPPPPDPRGGGARAWPPPPLRPPLGAVPLAPPHGSRRL